MPIARTMMTSWVCNFCGRGESHVAGTQSPLAEQYFIDQLLWVSLGPNSVACDRCKLRPEVANILIAAGTLHPSG